MIRTATQATADHQAGRPLGLPGMRRYDEDIDMNCLCAESAAQTVHIYVYVFLTQTVRI